MRFDEELTVNLEHRDFIKQALACLFKTQTDGTWRHYKPLFHYDKVGNAYCYVFETFAALLGTALQQKPQATMIRELLLPHGKQLMDLWRYADSTKTPLNPKNKDERAEIGWSSGHRINSKEPESWATASVFSYAQALRRLIGIWCREEVTKTLSSPGAKVTREKAAAEIVTVGNTWAPAEMSVGEQLFTMFVNPVLMHDCTDTLEPDSQPNGKSCEICNSFRSSGNGQDNTNSQGCRRHQLELYRDTCKSFCGGGPGSRSKNGGPYLYSTF